MADTKKSKELIKEFVQLQLPSKQKQRSQVQPASTAKINANCHKIDIDKKTQVVHNYEFHFFIETAAKDPERRFIKLWEGAKNE